MSETRTEDEYGRGEAVRIALNGQDVVSVTRNNGNIEAFHLMDGNTVEYDQAVEYVKSGNSEGLLAQTGNTGEWVIRSKPDSSTENNLDNLPDLQ